jgi:hypothetical protein
MNTSVMMFPVCCSSKIVVSLTTFHVTLDAVKINVHHFMHDEVNHV